MMKRAACVVGIVTVVGAAWLAAQPASVSLVDGYRTVEVASVADAMEQLYGQRAYMAHDMRPLAATKFAGPAVTVQLTKEEHKEGSAASQGMLDAIDDSAAGSVYVMVLENGQDYAGIGGLMATAMKYRGFAGAVIDASVRDTPQIRELQFPVFSRGVAPSTTINHYRVTGVNVPVTCAGVRVNPGDIVTADEDGVAVVPQAKAAEVLKKSQELDDTEHRMLPFIEKFRSIREAVKQFGRILISSGSRERLLPLLRVQHSRRLQPRRAPGGNHRRECRDRDDERDRAAEHQRIGGANRVDPARDDPAGRERRPPARRTCRRARAAPPCFITSQNTLPGVAPSASRVAISLAALRHRVGDDAVDADGREQDRDAAEDQHQRHPELLALNRARRPDR